MFGSAQHHADIVGEVAGREIIGAADDEVVILLARRMAFSEQSVRPVVNINLEYRG